MTSTSVDFLVTGFGPFGNVLDNPSAWLAEQSGYPNRILPVSWQAVDSFISECMASPPRKLLMLGVAANRAQLTPEIFGWNLNGPHADVDGIHREGEIEPDEPFYRTSTLWDPRTLSRWILAGVSGVSGSPGNYLCNYSLYRALGALPGTKVGFLHVPGDAHIEREVMLDKVKTICHDVQ